MMNHFVPARSDENSGSAGVRLGLVGSIFLVGCIGCSDPKNIANTRSAIFNPTATIGKLAPDQPIEAAINHPAYFSITDKFVIVGDNVDPRPKLFSLDGSYSHTAGVAGYGPGELGRPTYALEVAGELWVFDSETSRTTAFDVDSGHYLRSGVQPFTFIRTAAAGVRFSVVLNLAMGDDLPNVSNLFHVLNPEDFSVRMSFGDARSMWMDRFSPDLLLLDPGRLCTWGNGGVAYAPALFWGEVFRYSPNSDISDGGVERIPIPLGFSSSVEAASLVGVSEARGIVCGENGAFTLYLARSTAGGGKELEVYSVEATGIVEKSGRLHGVLFPDTEYWDFRVTIQGTSGGMLALLDADQQGDPRLRVGTIAWNDLKFSP